MKLAFIGASHWHLPLYLDPALEVPARGADGHQAGVCVESDRNDDAPERFQSAIKGDEVRDDRSAQGIVESRELGLQPVQECSGRASTRDVDRYLSARVAGAGGPGSCQSLIVRNRDAPSICLNKAILSIVSAVSPIL